MNHFKRVWYSFLKYQDIMLGGLACKAMQVRGYSSQPIHPKHLFDENRIDFLRPFLKPGIRFLDVGCGVGTECISSAKEGAICACGVDYALSNLTTSRERTLLEHVQSSFLQVDLEQGKLPFKSEVFDVINFTNVLEHIHNRFHLLCEVRRVKTKKGVIILSVPNSETTWKKKLTSVGLDPRDDDDHKIEYTMNYLDEELNQAGLHRISEFGPSIPSFPWNGLVAISAFLSPRLYMFLQREKRDYVSKKPEESIGWFVVVQ